MLEWFYKGWASLCNIIRVKSVPLLKWKQLKSSVPSISIDVLGLSNANGMKINSNCKQTSHFIGSWKIIRQIFIAQYIHFMSKYLLALWKFISFFDFENWLNFHIIQFQLNLQKVRISVEMSFRQIEMSFRQIVLQN